ncbi:fused MFS/spermidine synthase [Pelomonas sp. UHG3]|uniref:Fused MFS/spermidine synthase n=1 Tax=Roseateles hydrophilus TaxID=2975054 RepID=A0ACC6C8P7_9BURK|nr:fused MFS/spermidine synthase [Pelomonas sp. UHG3]MCY4744813.1 fused MFS/spermidine synthase [Pelomonas sp. UHG3]
MGVVRLPGFAMLHVVLVTELIPMKRRVELVLVGAAFACSGFAALVYQLVWQRLLFGAIGVDVESVTVVVSVFMLGLGVGAWMGGWLADRYPRRIVAVFAGFELGIAACGLVSVAVLTGLSGSLALLPRLGAGLVCFALLLLPTVLMGATLPMLVAHAAQGREGIGRATGWLYFVNTLGAAFGAWSMAFLLPYWLDLAQIVRLAAGLNLAASFAALLAVGRRA